MSRGCLLEIHYHVTTIPAKTHSLTFVRTPKNVTVKLKNWFRCVHALHNGFDMNESRAEVLTRIDTLVHLCIKSGLGNPFSSTISIALVTRVDRI